MSQSNSKLNQSYRKPRRGNLSQSQVLHQDIKPEKKVNYKEESGSEESIKSDEEYSEDDASDNSDTISYEEPEVESKLIKIAGKLYIGFFSGDVLLSKTEVHSVKAEEEKKETPKLGNVIIDDDFKKE